MVGPRCVNHVRSPKGDVAWIKEDFHHARWIQPHFSEIILIELIIEDGPRLVPKEIAEFVTSREELHASVIASVRIDGDRRLYVRTGKMSVSLSRSAKTCILMVIDCGIISWWFPKNRINVPLGDG